MSTVSRIAFFGKKHSFIFGSVETTFIYWRSSTALKKILDILLPMRHNWPGLFIILLLLLYKFLEIPVFKMYTITFVKMFNLLLKERFAKKFEISQFKVNKCLNFVQQLLTCRKNGRWNL